MTDEFGAQPDLLPISTADAPVPEYPVTVDMPTGEIAVADSTPDISPELTELYNNHARELGRIAFLLTSSMQDAEDVVAEVFLKIVERYDLRNIDEPLAFLRAAVVNKSRSMLRHRTVHDRALPKLAPGRVGDSTSESVLEAAESSVVIQALKQLPIRQRQAIVLRYYVDLSEREIAAAMGLRPGSVKSHTSRGLATLKRVLGPYLQQF